MKPPRSITDKPAPQELKTHLEQVSKVLSNISFGSSLGNSDGEQNIECHKAQVVSPVAPNTDFAVTHSLGRVPFGFIVVGISPPARISNGATAWTTTQIFLRSDVASTTVNLVII